MFLCNSQSSEKTDVPSYQIKYQLQSVIIIILFTIIQYYPIHTMYNIIHVTVMLYYLESALYICCSRHAFKRFDHPNQTYLTSVYNTPCFMQYNIWIPVYASLTLGLSLTCFLGCLLAILSAIIENYALLKVLPSMPIIFLLFSLVTSPAFAGA